MYSQILQYCTAAAVAFAASSTALPTEEHLHNHRSLAKRALPNFDWNDNLPNAAENREKAGDAWVGMITMANMVFNKNSDANRWPRIFKHYFNEAEKPKVDKVFSLIVGEGEQHDPNGIAAFMSNVFVTNHPPPGFEKACDEKGVVAYTVSLPVAAPRTPKYVIMICPYGYKFPVYTATGCDKLGTKVSGMMDTLDGILLHEVTHMHAYVGKPAVGEEIVDHGPRGYGPLNVRQFKDNSLNIPSVNADNYRIYAQELFWTELCNKQFGDAIDNTPYPDLTTPTPETQKPPPLPAGLTKAITVIYQSNVGKKDVNWVIYPGNYRESKICADDKDGYKFPTNAAPDNSFIMPFPRGTFPMKDVFGRQCDYKNDAGPGMLWCKEQDGKWTGIQCKEDPGRTAKDAVYCGKKKREVREGIYHIATVNCEW